MRSPALLPLSLLALSSVLPGAAHAQSSGFKEGDLFVYANSIQSPGYNGLGITRTDPLTGQSSVFVKALQLFDEVGSMAFDPYRQRLVFSAALPGVDPSPVPYLWFADGSGNLQNVTKGTSLNGIAFRNLAPGKDGRLYCTLSSEQNKPIRYLDAANQIQTLFAADGVTPMQIDGTDFYLIEGMIYDEATNSLFIASSKPAPGFPLDAINVRKLPLSADGSRVVGAVGNATFEVSPGPVGLSGSEIPRGWSHGPNGTLILIALNIFDEILPRMLQIDPATMAISAWGSNGDDTPGLAWATTTGGAYCSPLNKVVVMDYWFTKLRAYAKGSTGGPGTVIPTAPVSPGGYYVTVVSIPDDHCTGIGLEYGTGVAGAGGFMPHLGSSGCPDIGQTIQIGIDHAVGGGPGLLLLGFNQSAVPLFGGTLLLSPIALNLPITAAGAPGVPGAGTWSVPLGFSNPNFAGLSFYLQAGFVDGAAVSGISMTNGLKLTIG